MCNISNEMIQECIYSALTKTYHYLRQIKVELIISFFCACMEYVMFHSIYIYIYQCFSVGRWPRQQVMKVLLYIYPVPTDRVAFSQACTVIRKII